MPHEGYVDPITNDGPGFHSDMPVSELTEHVTRAIEASDVSLAPPVMETTDGVMHESDPNRAQRGSTRCLDPRVRLARSLNHLGSTYFL